MTKYLIVYKRDNDICWFTLPAETATGGKLRALRLVKSWKENYKNNSYSLLDVVELSKNRILEANWRDEYV